MSSLMWKNSAWGWIALPFDVQKINHKSSTGPSAIIIMPQLASTSTHSWQLRKQSSTGNKLTPPPPIPSSRKIPAQQTLQNTSTKAALNKVTITMQIPNSAAGFVIGHVGTGLCQISDFSHAKVSVAPPYGPSGGWVVTIVGTCATMGDAIVALGKQMAGKCVHTPRPKKKLMVSKTEPTVLARPPQSALTTLTPNPPPFWPMPVSSHVPTQVWYTDPMQAWWSRSISPTPLTPMVILVPSMTQTPGSSMEVDRFWQELNALTPKECSEYLKELSVQLDIPSQAQPSSHPTQTAWCGHPFGQGGRGR